MMCPDLEELLPSLRDSAPGDPCAPTEVYRRLKFLARVLGGGETTVGSEGIGAGGGARLLWLDDRGEPRSRPVGTEGVVIGRDPACDLILSGPRISRRHCVVRRRASAVDGATSGALGAEIEDLDSSNGTIVNGVKLVPGSRSLRDGDVIEVGGVALAVVIDQRKA